MYAKTRLRLRRLRIGYYITSREQVEPVCWLMTHRPRRNPIKRESEQSNKLTTSQNRGAAAYAKQLLLQEIVVAYLVNIDGITNSYFAH